MNWMYSCRRVAELLSRRLDEPLGLLDEMRLKLHLSMCGNCSNVATQLDALHVATDELLAGGFVDDAPPAGPDAGRRSNGANGSNGSNGSAGPS